MEGVGQEAVSLAGRLGLGKLVVVWDRNDQTSSGPLSETCADDVPLKFRACGWAVLEVDGHDIEAVARALNQRTHSDSPLLVAAKTSAGRGLPKVQGSHRAHAAALSEDEVMELARAAGVENIGSLAPTQVVTALIEERRAELARARGDWNARLSSYARAYPELHSEFVSKPRFDGSEFDRRMTEWKTATTTQSTRDSFGTVVDAIFDSSPLVVGASIDSHKAFVIRHGIYSATNRSGRNVNCGVREHAMGALLNGLAYYDLRPFGVCFAAFLDHLRPSLRLAAMDSLPLVVAAVNDSALSGEDGPTHQAVEQLAGLRAMPNLVTFRPADLLETVMAWMFALENRRPVVMFLSKVACRPISSYEPENSYDGVLRGGYPVGNVDPDDEMTIVASGSEVQLALGARQRLGRPIRVVSMPSTELFAMQSEAYRDGLLSTRSGRLLVVEAATRFGWDSVLRRPFDAVTVERFGASGSSSAVATAFGFTVDHVVERASALLSGS
jgi:transketolase